MKTPWFILLSASTTVTAVLVAVATSADEPRPEGGAAAIDGGAAAIDGGADAPPLPLRSWSVDPFPEERSAEPKAKEWDAAPSVALDRPHPTQLVDTEGASSAPCEAHRLREWIRIRCRTMTGAISLLGGEREGVAMRFDPVDKEDFFQIPGAGEVVFPVRRGDRRAIEWLGMDIGYKGMQSLVPFIVISEQWPPGDERPMIVLE